MRSRETAGASGPIACLGIEEVLAVLPAARVGAVRGGEERERIADAVVAHLGSASAMNGCQLRLPK